jgi:O-antigen/teichoic acid export membrane protein
MEAETHNLQRAVRRGFLWVGLGSAIGQFVSWASTIVVIRQLAPEDYGLMAMSMSFVAFLSMMSELGVGASVIQAKEISDEDVRKVYGLVILCGLAFMVAGYAAAPLVAAFYNEPRLVPIIRVVNISFLLSALYVIPQSLAVRRMDFRVKSEIDIAAQVVSALLMVAMALSGAGVWTLVAGPLTAHGVRAAAFGVVGGRPILPSFDLRGVRRWLTFGLTITADRLAYYAYSVSDIVIVGRLLGDSVLGVYSLAMTLASLPSEKVLPMVTQVSFASFSRIQDDPARIGRNVLSALKTVSFVAWPLFFLMAAVAPEAIPLVLGERWRSIVVPFQVLCLSMPVKAMGFVFAPAIFAVGRPVVNLGNMIITGIVMTAAFLAGVRFGPVGVCVAWTAVYPPVFLFTSWRSLKVLNLGLGDFFKETWFPFAASLVTLLVLFAIRSSVIMPAATAAMVLLPLVGACLFAALVFAFQREEYAKLKGFLVG